MLVVAELRVMFSFYFSMYYVAKEIDPGFLCGIFLIGNLLRCLFGKPPNSFFKGKLDELLETEI